MNPRRESELRLLALLTMLVLISAWAIVFKTRGQEIPAAPAATGGRFERADDDDGQAWAAGRLALRVAQVAVNEGALRNRGELELVWQTVESNAQDLEDRRDWLRRHSRRVHGLARCPSGRNCQWTPQLDRTLRQPPALSLPSADFWRLRVEPIWEDALRYADWLVRGGRYRQPCHVPPRTWGGERDREAAIKRGLFPIGCSGTENDGYATERVCRRDGRWLCDPSYDPERTRWCS